MTNREQSVIDDIDALVDEQMAGGEPIGGYDYSDPDYPKCPHCRRTWHGLAITQRIEGMAWRGVLDPDYRYADDDSPVLCPGSNFIGPVVTPDQLAWIRGSEELKQVFPDGRLHPVEEMISAAHALYGDLTWVALASNPFFQSAVPVCLPTAQNRAAGYDRLRAMLADLGDDALTITPPTEPLWTLPDYPSDSAPYTQGLDVNDGDRVAFMSTNRFRYTGIARVEHHGTETVIHLDETEESRLERIHTVREGSWLLDGRVGHRSAPPQWQIAVGDDPARSTPDTPQERALPRPATRPPMWANDPAHTRRGRNRARSIRTPRI